MKKPTVPNTITAAQMADLARRAQRVAPPTLSPEAIRRRLASAEQQRKAGQS